MSDHAKSGNVAFERRMKLYKELGLKTKIVHKTGVMVIFPGKHIVKEDDDNEEISK